MKTLIYICLVVTMSLLALSCKKEPLESKSADTPTDILDTTGNNLLIPDFRDNYFGNFSCNKYYKQVHQDTAGNLYWTTTLVSLNAAIVVEAEADSSLLVNIDGGSYQANYSSTDCFSLSGGNLNFNNSGDSISIYLQSSPMNSYTYSGNKASI